MIEIDQTTLETGLPVVKLKMPGTRAITALVAFDAGARTERPDENGMAHFLEHLVFKGGESYPTYRDVNETAERLGAQLNAYTSHDIVAFHVTSRSGAPSSARRSTCARSRATRSWPSATVSGRPSAAAPSWPAT